MRFYTLLFLTVVSFIGMQAQVSLSVPLEVETPEQIKSLHQNNIIGTYSVDFDGDKIQDYISIIETGLDNEPLTREYWYTSGFKLYRTVDLIVMDYDFKFFVNIDGDSIPEIIRAQGYPEGIDYYFTKQNILTGEEEVLFYFNPIIRKANDYDYRYFWGHPWGLKSILVQQVEGGVRLLSSVQHEIIRDSEIHYPAQSCFPLIFFEGTPKSEYDYSEKIGDIELMTVDEIILGIRLTK
ncbi:hypothetical protein [Carboxylicivirga marina]|uniref:Uncharacterized protein n=1 Tax=Carboxylicivirga marina TaxID=2800988 RepID=A0ABS1HLE4_9BACT|nr:hypothetical protein [Carboxylicivirga marina]MBK3518483.1 hypothetical protein [Carboxylicivirga marina]